jgi:hypothetical protein
MIVVVQSFWVPEISYAKSEIESIVYTSTTSSAEPGVDGTTEGTIRIPLDVFMKNFEDVTFES